MGMRVYSATRAGQSRAWGECDACRRFHGLHAAARGVAAPRDDAGGARVVTARRGPRVARQGCGDRQALAREYGSVVGFREHELQQWSVLASLICGRRGSRRDRRWPVRSDRTVEWDDCDAGERQPPRVRHDARPGEIVVLPGLSSWAAHSRLSFSTLCSDLHRALSNGCCSTLQPGLAGKQPHNCPCHPCPRAVQGPRQGCPWDISSLRMRQCCPGGEERHSLPSVASTAQQQSPR